MEPVTDPEAVRERVARAAPEQRVPVAFALRGVDPFDAYRRARGEEPAFFLETGGGQSGWGYFGVAPDRFVQRDAGGLDAVDSALAGESLARGDCPIPFPGGVFGWLSYDLVRETESLPGGATADRDLPVVQLGRYPCLAAWECPVEDGDPLYVVATPRVDEVGSVLVAARRLATDLASRVRTGSPSIGPPPAGERAATFTSDCGREAFTGRVRRVEDALADGETFQANVSHRLRAPATVHPVSVYAALRECNPAPYAGLIEFPGVSLVSASPELLLDRDGDRVATEPIAGTRPRGDGERDDAALERALRRDAKERAEHDILVDLERNDLGAVCRPGTVDVTEYRRVDRYSEVMHLVSRVVGRLRTDATLRDAVAATFPGGTVTGAPKPRTVALIDEVEATRRGPYTGSVAALGFDGRATLNIVIRTLVQYGDEYHLRVGAGVVQDSDPDREYDETLDKARALVTAVDRASGDADVAVEGGR